MKVNIAGAQVFVALGGHRNSRQQAGQQASMDGIGIVFAAAGGQRDLGHGVTLSGRPAGGDALLGGARRVGPGRTTTA